MAPLQVDPSDYLKPHHSAGRCLTDAWRSAHQGAMNFGQGYVQVIRNPNTHGDGELPEQEAREYLAALGVLADCTGIRWYRPRTGDRGRLGRVAELRER